MAKEFTCEDVYQELCDRVKSSTQKAVACSIGVSVQMLNDVVHGRRNLTENIADALGYRKVIVYRKKQA